MQFPLNSLVFWKKYLLQENLETASCPNNSEILKSVSIKLRTGLLCYKFMTLNKNITWSKDVFYSFLRSDKLKLSRSCGIEYVFLNRNTKTISEFSLTVQNNILAKISRKDAVLSSLRTQWKRKLMAASRI